LIHFYKRSAKLVDDNVEPNTCTGPSEACKGSEREREEWH